MRFNCSYVVKPKVTTIQVSYKLPVSNFCYCQYTVKYWYNIYSTYSICQK